MVLMTCSQYGKTVYLINRILHEAIKHWGEWLGYYFPDYLLAGEFSKNRFRTTVNGIPQLREYLGQEISETGRKETQDNVRARRFGMSIIYFLSVCGKTATEGFPMFGIFFDEVRRMMLTDIAKAEQRVTGRLNPIDLKASTAGTPDCDIDFYYQQSTQNEWISRCNCPDGVNLPRSFPDCLGKSNGTTPSLAKYGDNHFYVCPRCSTVIDDPQNGDYVSMQPNREIAGYQLSKIVSPVYTAERLYQEYIHAESIREFYNSGLGLPYIDKESQPIDLETLYACETYPRWEDRGDNCGMGIDSMGGYNVVTIKKRLDNGHHATVHLEIVVGDDPWERCGELMNRYDCTCIADQKPNINEAVRFAKKFPGRVWLAYYNEGEDGEMVEWMDKVDKKTTDPSPKELKFKFMVRIHRFKAIEWSLERFVNRENSLPPRRGLTQVLPKKDGRVILSAGMKLGIPEPCYVAQEVYYYHLQKIAKRTMTIRTKEGEDTGKRKMVWVNLGLDPHFVHANLYADLALMRRKKLQFCFV
jgi:hypothetical protein